MKGHFGDKGLFYDIIGKISKKKIQKVATSAVSILKNITFQDAKTIVSAGNTGLREVN